MDAVASTLIMSHFAGHGHCQVPSQAYCQALSPAGCCSLDPMQVYEETAGLTVGDVVTRTKKVRQMRQNLDMQQSMQTQRL